jgi:imidazolonepropionase-like amidohydrolase
VVFESGSILMQYRAFRVASEAGVRPQLVASGQEWRRPDLLAPLAKAAVPFIVPLHFPALPKFPEDSAWDSVSLDVLRAWDWAPENPALLVRSGLTIALTTHSLPDRKSFRTQLRTALDRGLSESDALAGMTTAPAALCGLSDSLGTLESGKLAHLTVVEPGGGFFDPASRVTAVWIDGVAYETDAALKTPEKKEPNPEAEAKKAAERDLANRRVAHPPMEGRGPIVQPGSVIVRNATIWTSGPQGIVSRADLLVANGRIQAVGSSLAAGPAVQEIDGTGLHVTPGILDCHSHSMILGAVNEATLPSTAMVRIADVVNSESENIHQQLAGGTTLVNLLHGSANPIGGQNCVIKLREGATPEALKFEPAPGGIKFALGENVKQSGWGDKAVTRFPQTRMGVGTFYRNRFTAAQQYREAFRKGRQSDGSPVRRDLELEALMEILVGTRLIHCHSYRQDEILAFLRMMESFGVRVASLQHILEGYKVADEIARHGAGASAFADWWAYKYEVIDAIPYAGSLMRERGVTVSFNSDSSDHARRLNFEAAKAVKYGGTPEAEALKFEPAPGGIKFALGENVKQSGWGDKAVTRFPQTRMGVGTFYRNRFTAAQQYRDAFRKGRQSDGSPVRRDLELEALVEILEGTRLIHCHSYRQDEILAFLRVMESFGVRVASLQHILEGYKVADEIARHGAGASAFADWWAYKYEVIDAIPYAGSLMRERGVTVSFNSDSSDHARRLNFEAAKAVKYGGTPEAEALKFVTLNPAKQLGIDHRVGSLESGKDADFVIWNGSPLDSATRCLETWVDGRCYFRLSAESARVKALQEERTALLAKARKIVGDGGESNASDKARKQFFERALEQARHWGVKECQDCLVRQAE